MPVRDIWKVKIGTYIFEVFDVKRPHKIVKTLERGGNPAGLDKSVGLTIGSTHVETGFKTYVKTLGTEGSYPTITDLIKASGFNLTTSDSDSDTIIDTFIYKPLSLSDTTTTLTIEMKVDNDYYIKITDAIVKSLKIDIKIGEPIVAEFDFVGVFSSEDTTTAITGDYDIKEPFISKSLTISSGVPDYFEAFSLEINNDVAERVSPSSTYGVQGYIITGQKITGSINPEAILKSTGDVLTPFSIQVGSSTDYFKIEGAKVVITDRTFTERNGLLLVDLPLAFYPSAAGSNDALTLTFRKV